MRIYIFTFYKMTFARWYKKKIYVIDSKIFAVAISSCSYGKKNPRTLIYVKIINGYEFIRFSIFDPLPL